MNRKNYKVGLLGAGYILDAHAQALRTLPDVALSAVCDISAARAEAAARAHGIGQVFTALDDLLRSDVDAVHVLLPPQHHVAATRAILQSGKNAFVEKPMGLSSAECDELVELAAAKGLKLGVNHNFLFLPAYERLRRDVRDGTTGPLDHVAINWLYPLGLIQYGPFNNWMLQSESNLVFEVGAHLAAFAIDLVGPLEDVHSVASRPIDLPGGQRVFRQWMVTGRRNNTAVSLALSFTPGQADRSVHVRGYAANGHLDFERDVYSRSESRTNSPVFDQFAIGRTHALQTGAQAMRNFGKRLLGTLRKRPESGAFSESIQRSVAAFYGGLDGSIDSRLEGRFGAEVIRLCERIAASAPGSAAPRRVPTANTLAAAPTVLVIGGSGFIGKRLVNALVDAGHSVRVFSRSRAGAACELDGLPVDIAEGSLHDPVAIARAFDGIDVVYDLAKATGKRWSDYLDGDVVPTRLLAEAALKAGVRRFIYTGTIDSYDSASAQRTIDGSTPLDPDISRRNHYARSKAACEALLMEMHLSRGLPLVIFRPGIVIGAGCPPAHWGVGLFHTDTRVQFWGDGTNKLPFVLVDDVAEALVRAFDAPGIEGQSFLLTGPPLLSAEEYVEAVSARTGTRIRTQRTPAWQFFVADAAKELAKHAIGHPNRKRPSYHDWACRSHRSRYDSRATSEVLDWHPADTRERLTERGIDAAVRHALR